MGVPRLRINRGNVLAWSPCFFCAHGNGHMSGNIPHVIRAWVLDTNLRDTPGSPVPVLTGLLSPLARESRLHLRLRLRL